MTKSTELHHKKPDNPLLNLIFNIFLPIFILNKGHNLLGLSSFWTLILALTFPFGFGLYDLLKNKKTNFLSILGLINVSITGSLALLGLGGIWFSVKEAAFPLLVGLFVAFSSRSKKPFMETLFFNPSLVNTELIDEKLNQSNSGEAFSKLMKKSTLLLSISFLISGLVNFILAERIFLPLENLSPEQHSLALNAQLAEMTKWSMAVLLIPSMIFMMGLFFYVVKKIETLTGLTQEQIFPDSKTNPTQNKSLS